MPHTGPLPSFANGLDNKLPFPTSQLFDVYGDQALYVIALGAHAALGEAISFQNYAHLPDVQSYYLEP